jgi:DNA repair protein RecO (recombination protein O)
VPLVRTPAVVLRAYDYGDSSRIFRLYTRDLGLQSLLVRGVKEARSRFRGVLDLFNLVEVSYWTRRGRSLHAPREADLLEPHLHLKRDLDRMLAFGAVVRLLHALSLEDEANPGVFAFLVETAAAFDRPELAPESVEPLRHFACWQLLARKGYAPEVDCCVACGAVVGGRPAFVVAEGGVACARCAPGGPALSSREYGALQLFLHGDGGLAAGWRLTEGEGRRLDRIREDFAVYHAGIRR